MADDIEHVDANTVSSIRKHLKKLHSTAAYNQHYNRLWYYKPHPQTQLVFHNSKANEKAIILGNQQGKTECCSREMAFHALGEYPEWHSGRHLIPPAEGFIGWIGSVTSQAVRDNAQIKMLGPISAKDELGTGAIPLDCIESFSMSRGIADFVDSIRVRRPDGGIAVLTFKTYEQSVLAWQGVPVSCLWYDEDIGYDFRLYSEGLARTISTGGQLIVSMTPMLGSTPLVKRFAQGGPGIFMVRGGIEQALHIPKERRDAIIASMPEHERAARAFGFPMQGEGAVFSTPVHDIIHDLKYEDTEPHWRWAWGVDFQHGGQSSQSHAFAVVLGCHDTDADIVYLFDAARMFRAGIDAHVARIKTNPCFDAPILWPHDGGQSGDASSGETIADLYRARGLNLRRQHTTFPEGGYSFEAGIQMLNDRLSTGRLKVSRHLADWFEEYSNYHYKDGKVVKEDDDLMSATRVLCMGIRHCRALGKDILDSADGYRRKSNFRANTNSRALGAADYYWGID